MEQRKAQKVVLRYSGRYNLVSDNPADNKYGYKIFRNIGFENGQNKLQNDKSRFHKERYNEFNRIKLYLSSSDIGKQKSML